MRRQPVAAGARSEHRPEVFPDHAAPEALEGSPDLPPSRLVVLDVLRGVALCGIIWLNVPTMTQFTYGTVGVDDVAPWIDTLARGRFIGLFAALFGVSFALVLHGATRRSPRPRVVLARRFALLAVIGIVHGLLQPGEVLRNYAVVGLVVLLPLSFVRWRWAPLLLGVAALAGSLAIHLDPAANHVGMMLLGYGAARLGLLERLERPGRGVKIAAAALVVGYVVALVLQQTVTEPIVDGVSFAYSRADFAAGVVGAAAYGVVVVLALRTRLRPALRAVFEPLGRLALSNYVGASVLAVAVRQVSGGASLDSTGPDLLLCAVLLLAQVAGSRWWLARFRYGPLEWAWRCGTWWQLVPNRRR